MLFVLFTKIRIVYRLTLIEASYRVARKAGIAFAEKTRTFCFYWKKFQTNPKRIMKSR
jgi:hypothetical protein